MLNRKMLTSLKKCFFKLMFLQLVIVAGAGLFFGLSQSDKKQQNTHWTAISFTKKPSRTTEELPKLVRYLAANKDLIGTVVDPFFLQTLLLKRVKFIDQCDAGAVNPRASISIQAKSVDQVLKEIEDLTKLITTGQVDKFPTTFTELKKRPILRFIAFNWLIVSRSVYVNQQNQPSGIPVCPPGNYQQFTAEEMLKMFAGQFILELISDLRTNPDSLWKVYESKWKEVQPFLKQVKTEDLEGVNELVWQAKKQEFTLTHPIAFANEDSLYNLFNIDGSPTWAKLLEDVKAIEDQIAQTDNSQQKRDLEARKITANGLVKDRMLAKIDQLKPIIEQLKPLVEQAITVKELEDVYAPFKAKKAEEKRQAEQKRREEEARKKREEEARKKAEEAKKKLEEEEAKKKELAERKKTEEAKQKTEKAKQKQEKNKKKVDNSGQNKTIPLALASVGGLFSAMAIGALIQFFLRK